MSIYISTNNKQKILKGENYIKLLSTFFDIKKETHEFLTDNSSNHFEFFKKFIPFTEVISLNQCLCFSSIKI
jgi:hypothetical protein